MGQPERDDLWIEAESLHFEYDDAEYDDAQRRSARGAVRRWRIRSGRLTPN